MRAAGSQHGAAQYDRGHERHTTVLSMLAARLPTIRPSQSLLADDCKLSLRTVGNTLSELREHGLIAFDGGKVGVAIVYTIDLIAIQRLCPGSEGTQPLRTPPPQGTQPLRTRVSSHCVPGTQPLRTARGEGRDQEEGGSGAREARTSAQTRRAPLPHGPARHQPGRLQDTPPPPRPRTRQAP